MARTRDTGEGDPYTDQEEGELEAALDRAFHGYGPGDPTGADVTAQIEWAGTVDNNGRGGVRRTRLDGLDPAKTREIRQLIAEARREAGREPLRSYKAKGWAAQLKQLAGTARGREALKAAGWSASRETLRRYGLPRSHHLAQAPSKANRARIAEAYDNTRNPGRSAAENARHAAAEKLTEAVMDRYGVVVRFREIQSWTWR